MPKQTAIIAIAVVILILLGGNIFLGAKYFTAQKELNQIQTVVEAKETNEKVLNFTKLFMEEVLKAEGEVNFETRLKLENSVRDLNNDEILNQWKKFIEAEDENEAQKEVKNLLWLLINKVSVLIQ